MKQKTRKLWAVAAIALVVGLTGCQSKGTEQLVSTTGSQERGDSAEGLQVSRSGSMKKRNQRIDRCAYAMIFPAYFVFAVFILIPIFVVFYYSITNFNMYSKPEFVGLKNYLV